MHENPTKLHLNCIELTIFLFNLRKKNRERERERGTFSSWWRAIQTWTLSMECQNTKAPSVIAKKVATFTIFFFFFFVHSLNQWRCSLWTLMSDLRWKRRRRRRRGFPLEVIWCSRCDLSWSATLSPSLTRCL